MAIGHLVIPYCTHANLINSLNYNGNLQFVLPPHFSFTISRFKFILTLLHVNKKSVKTKNKPKRDTERFFLFAKHTKQLQK